ncbi:ATP-binding protein [Metabacillus herbersteinensis]|uniref:ATP-binding protein n=1 Tax=Metabacillus herbersteinensis TaxID=283816 RepID=A0ABV6GBT9_9BACI
MLEVRIPSVFTRETMYLLLEAVIDRDLHPKDNEIKFKFRGLNFIEPAGVTILSNIFEWLRKRGVKVILNYPREVSNDKKNPLKYLDDSMFFMRYMKRTLTDSAEIRETTIPLELIAYSDSYQWLDRDFIPWLSRQLNVTKQSLADIKMCFGEIFNNTEDHAQENIGCIFAQHYPKSCEVKIAVSDFGIGIPNNIRKIDPFLKDDSALERAIQEGITSRTSPRNLGAGLHTLIKNVVGDIRGSVHIHSNYGILNCTYGNNGIKTESAMKNSFYPGTFIEFVLRTDNIPNIDDDEEEFDW